MAEISDADVAERIRALYGDDPGTCTGCGGPFHTFEARAGYTTCEHCPAPGDLMAKLRESVRLCRERGEGSA